ncbi:MAG: LysR family transcriptional regulator [Ilumatobacter sp.]|uniref:LysR family transcriptional regulator n=1 Tax=Ilumatobacter sp. TaxID=1967498 RepID=UPI003299C959
MIDLSALVSLRAVDACGSVVGAAEALGFTPSAVSQQVKRLERQAGLPLLERVGRGVIVTVHGRQLLDAGAGVLTALEELESGLHDSAGAVAGHIRLIAFSTAMRGLVAATAAALLAAHDDLTLTLSEGEPWAAVDLVASGQCEIGIVHSWGDVPIDVPDHLVTVPITSDVADVIVPHAHPLAGRCTVTPHDLIDEAWIATPDGTICRQWLNRMYDGTGRRPRIAHEAQEFASHLAMTQAGLGVALVPRLGRPELAADLAAVEVAAPVPTRNVVAVHRRTMETSPAIRAILDALISATG